MNAKHHIALINMDKQTQLPSTSNATNTQSTIHVHIFRFLKTVLQATKVQELVCAR